MGYYYFPSSHTSSYPSQMQIERTNHVDALNNRGFPNDEGWSRRMVWKYNRSSIKKPSFRIKEWDYFAIYSQDNDFYFCTTVSDLGYAGFVALAFLDLKTGKYSQIDTIKPLTFGSIGLKENTNEDFEIPFSSKDISINYSKIQEQYFIDVDAPNMILPSGEKGLNAHIRINRDESKDSMNILTSWKEDRKAFYLNEKFNNLPTAGLLKLGKNTFDLPSKSTHSVLDWGRGVWTYQNRWFWGSASGTLNGLPFGFNIGYGFSDRSPASENAVFYNGTLHKLDDVVFHIDTYLKPWRFSSNNGRFELMFEPILDRESHTNLILMKSDQHQVFGRFSGDIILDNGSVLQLKNFTGFAEDVFNRW